MATDETIRRPQVEHGDEKQGEKGAAANVNQTYRETDTVTELNDSSMAFK